MDPQVLEGKDRGTWDPVRTPCGMEQLPHTDGAHEASYRNTKKRRSSLQQLQKLLRTPGPGESFWEMPSQFTCARASAGETLPKRKVPQEPGLLPRRLCSLNLRPNYSCKWVCQKRHRRTPQCVSPRFMKTHNFKGHAFQYSFSASCRGHCAAQ